MSINYTAEMSVSADRIADMFVGAIEGGSNYWCQSLLLKSGTASGIWYADANLYSQPTLEIEAHFDDPDQSEGNGAGRFAITPEKIQSGIRKMASDYPSHFADLLLEQDDAETADVFLQCVILGEIVYG